MGPELVEDIERDGAVMTWSPAARKETTPEGGGAAQEPLYDAVTRSSGTIRWFPHGTMLLFRAVSVTAGTACADASSEPPSSAVAANSVETIRERQVLNLVVFTAIPCVPTCGIRTRNGPEGE
jgi:hypothetical protein